MNKKTIERPSVALTPVTLNDIAHRAGVSTATVSRALNGRVEISRETIIRVKSIAADLGYIPKRTGRARQARRSKTIGLVIADSSNPLFSKIVKGAQDMTCQHGFDLILSNTDESYDRERHSIAALIDSGVDGLLLTPAQSKRDDITSLIRNGLPFVLVGRHFPGMEVDSVVADDEGGALAATDHLIRLGHQRILFINAPQYVSSAEERLQGYHMAFEKNGIDAPPPELLRTCSPRLDSAYNLMKSVIVEQIQFTAVFAFCDLMMLGVFQALREAGRSIPEDLSLVGFDDIEFVSLLDPPLTTVHMPKYSLGRESARILLSRLGRKTEPSQHVLPTELIVRGSTARARL